MHFLQHMYQMTVFALMTHLNPTCAVVNQRDTLFFQYGDGGVTLSSAMDRGLFSHTLSFNKRSNPVNMETMHCLLLNQLRESVVEPLSLVVMLAVYGVVPSFNERGQLHIQPTSSFFLPFLLLSYFLPISSSIIYAFFPSTLHPSLGFECPFVCHMRKSTPYFSFFFLLFITGAQSMSSIHS